PAPLSSIPPLAPVWPGFASPARFYLLAVRPFPVEAPPHACCHTASIASTHPGPSSTRPPSATNCPAAAHPREHHPRPSPAMAATAPWLWPGAPLRALRALARPHAPGRAAVLLLPAPRAPALGGGAHPHRPAPAPPQRIGPAHAHLAVLAA